MKDKANLRKLYLKKRNELTEAEKNQYAEDIYHHLFDQFDFNNKVVSIFLPIKKFNEVNTYPIFDRLTKNSDTTVGLSVSQMDNSTMQHKRWDKSIVIKENKWGIPEPSKGDIIKNEIIDIVLVPMLVCDQNGFRVGYGKGFYDRFLKTCKKEALFIGLNYFPPTSSILKDETDVPVHHLVTPQQIYSFV